MTTTEVVTGGRRSGPGVVLVVPPAASGWPGVKRLIDVVASAALLLALLPLLLAVGLLVRLESPGPALFRQVRLGQHRRTFRIWKFRTMRQGSEHELPALAEANEVQAPLFKIAEDPRVTRVGRILRRWSLDELPQLVNVLVGDMSLVGPRPPLPTEAAVDGVHQDLRLRVRPGMTGLWQVNGRSHVCYPEMVAMDLAYVHRSSLPLDAWILLRTIGAVLRGRGAC